MMLASIVEDHKTHKERIPRTVLHDKGFKKLGQGRHRCVYLCPSGHYVIKFPINSDGEVANIEEAQAYKNGRGCVAKCRLFEYNEACCLIMEAVAFPDDGEAWHQWSQTLPKWVKYIDCWQVGYNRKGELVAYDFSFI
jgi:hypothetical protein